jgi:hypothetical protein
LGREILQLESSFARIDRLLQFFKSLGLVSLICVAHPDLETASGAVSPLDWLKTGRSPAVVADLAASL